MYNVFFLTPGEFTQAVIMPDFKPAEFETIEEAKAFIAGQVNEEDKVQPGDNSNAATICYHIYDGSPYDEDGEVVAEPVYISDDYYYHP
jgi:hypothetical protein